MTDLDINNQLRILWVSHLVPYPPRAGVLSRSYNLLREVSRIHEVHLVSFIQSAWFKTFFDSVEYGLREARDHLASFCSVHEFIQIESEKHGHIGRLVLAARSLLADPCFTLRWLDSDSMRSALARQAAHRAFDLVHFDTISLAPYRALFPGVPATLGHHNVESHMLARRAEQEQNLLVRAYLRQEARRLLAYERLAVDEFQLNITCSALDSERLLFASPGACVSDVPNGVDIEFFQRSQATPVGHDLLFVGTMDWYPNVAAVEFFLTEAWPEIKRRRPGITFGIVGSNPPRKLVEQARNDSGLTVYGYVDDVRPFLAGAKVFVCPIRDGGGTKLKVLDALSMGCAVVAHPIACEGIEVRDGRDICLAEGGRDFAEAIDRLLGDPVARAALGRAGRDLVASSYSYAALGRQLAGLWQAVSAARRHLG